MRVLCRDQGLAVLWATHLIDEVGDESQVIVLHRGRILADGPARDVMAACGAASMRPAFDSLVREADHKSESKP